jgi:hypothetical protein
MVDSAMVDEGPSPLSVDFTRPNVARVYDAFLGGKDNFAVDRGFVDRTMRLMPDSVRGRQDQPCVPAAGGALPRRRSGHPPVH